MAIVKIAGFRTSPIDIGGKSPIIGGTSPI